MPTRTSHFQHNVGGELAGNSRLANAHSAFGDHVIDVFPPAPKKQMGGIDAFGIVAAVADLHAFGNRAALQFIANAMGVARSLACPLDLPVTVGLAGSNPLPTFIWIGGAIDFRPEAGNVGWGILGLHVEPPVRCAKPRDASNVAVALCRTRVV